MKYFVLSLFLLACAGEGATGGGASPKDRAGKLAGDELAPYDPEPEVDAGPAMPDAGAALPDAGGALPDARAELGRDAGPETHEDAAQAPADGGNVPTVDAGPATVAGAWRVTRTPVGMPCAGAQGATEEWGGNPEADTLATPSGTLSRTQAGFEGVWGGVWAVTLTVALDGAGFSGQLARKGVSCSDRWTVMGVRP